MRKQRKITTKRSREKHEQQVRSVAFQVSGSFIEFPEHIINVEQVNLLHSLQKCLELRDKYMLKSCQRLGDDPRDYDGHFQPLGDDCADVSGVRPDFPHHAKHREPQSQQNTFTPWKIYPKPPPPHWHWKDKEVVSADGTSKPGDGEFKMEDCEIPGPYDGWSYAIDVKGVFQVYDDTKGPFIHLPGNLVLNIHQRKTQRKSSLYSTSPTSANTSSTSNMSSVSSRMVRPKVLHTAG